MEKTFERFFFLVTAFVVISLFSRCENKITLTPEDPLGDTIAPAISISSPVGQKVYDSNTITLQWAIQDSTFKSAWYSADNEQTKIQIAKTGTKTLSLTNGTYKLIFYAEDESGNFSKKEITFTVRKSETAISSSQKFTKLFLIRIGGSLLSNGDENIISKYDYVLMNRFHYQNINRSTYSSIKKLNPGIKILIYQMGAEVSDRMDSYGIIELNNLGRFNISRGHSMGSLNGNHPELFLLDSKGSRIYTPQYPGMYLMDMGSNDYRNYWMEASRNDIVKQAWVADGIFMDGCWATLEENGYSAMPVKYLDNNLAVNAMTGFMNAMSGYLSQLGQLTGANTGNARLVNGAEAWLVLDRMSTPPDFALEEGAFAVAWGSSDVQYYSMDEWKRQVDLLKQVKNYKPFYQAHTDLTPGQSGTGSDGKPVTFWDVLWYSLASFQVGKCNNSYFGFTPGFTYNKIYWFDEYNIDLGNALGDYQQVKTGSATIYMREFEKGYVFVNPDSFDASNISLPVSCRQLTHDNLLSDPSLIAQVRSINLKSHRGTFLLKVSN
jgi:hypothetical protein